MAQRFDRYRRAAGITAAAMCLGAAALSAQDQAPDAELVKKGEALFETQKCAQCHSVAGKGNKKYPLDGVGKKLSEAEIRQWLVDPASMHAKQSEKPAMKMRSYKSLPDEEIDALVAYMKSLQ